jgi:hypothetical protein
VKTDKNDRVEWRHHGVVFLRNLLELAGGPAQERQKNNRDDEEFAPDVTHENLWSLNSHILWRRG